MKISRGTHDADAKVTQYMKRPIRRGKYFSGMGKSSKRIWVSRSGSLDLSVES